MQRSGPFSGFPVLVIDMSEKKAVFFCSAVKDIAPEYFQFTRQAVRAACLSGYDIVSGGTVKGLMGCVCDEAAKHGVEVIGALPRFMKGLEHPALTQCIWTDKMSERKDAMREGTCLAVALPGGIGTLDELAETYCLAKMRLYSGRVVALNINGFYEPLKAQLDMFVREKMLTVEDRALISFPKTINELTELL